MSCAIKFDNYATFWTIKVGNVRTYAVLSPEFLSVQLTVSQAGPQYFLGLRAAAPEFAATFGEG